jgi:predicted DNA-binding transcriptional regulator AlpA
MINSLNLTAEQVARLVATEVERAMRGRDQCVVVPEYLTPHQVAQMTGFSSRALEAMRSRREGPPYLKVGSSVRYRAADVRQWIENEGQR